ncbi:hypothetical protein [Cupriavidus pauculus]|uniref:hypothetical protein n=1 Tax=Cupriavidus pauculus TaxID=82633 RepID=UPI001EE35F7A|nr:hypothetical protein [Cupriavidus pauculus]GJG94335.1 hypothetical protein CBA19C6_07620 [Cupriavidus pauculus]
MNKFLALCIISIPLSLMFKYPPNDSGQWASWVQAIGSIAAILGAVWVVLHQIRLAEKARLNAILAVAGAARDLATQFRTKLKNEEEGYELVARLHQPSVLGNYSGALASLQPHEIRSAVGIAAFLELRKEFNFMDRAIDEYLQGPEAHRTFSRALVDFKEEYPNDPAAYREEYKRWSETLAVLADESMRNVENAFDRLRDSVGKHA